MLTTHCELLLLRHGETDWNREGRLQGQTDIALNALGEQQARAAADFLIERIESDGPIDAVYASDLKRAFVTAQAFAERVGVMVQNEPGVRERHYGDFEGKRRTDLPTLFPNETRNWRGDVLALHPPGGESHETFMARVDAALASIARRHPGQRVLVATHGGVLDCAYRLANGLPAQTPRAWPIANASINTLHWCANTLSIVNWGEVAHLQSVDIELNQPFLRKLP
jgi:probable phosphoglycerate mutase